ncbi:MAG: DNA primase [Lentisphaeraceae bacterium]|nr:DNA primase [Lentisphaeraceae bacterium]
MSGIDDQFIQTVKDRSDIVDVIGSYTQVKRAGRNFLALCPFHNEKSPSFNINADNQFFHCFGCGVSGDVISFVKQHENLDFIDAIKYLANRYNIPVPEFKGGNPRNRSEKVLLYELHADVCEWFKNNLKLDSAKPVREYLTKRGITDSDVSTFQVGYAPDSWDSLIKWARSKKYSMEILVKAGLVVHKPETNRYYDRFRDRLMFSIWNDEGKVIAFSGRVLNKEAKGGKYVNSPETLIFYKSSVLYALSHARRNFRELGAAILCEGQLDVIACHRAGLKNTVSTLGTAFTEDHARKLKRYADRVIIAFDADSAGQKAAFKSLETLLPMGINPQVLSWGEGMDPDSLYAEKGPEALKECVAQAQDLMEVFLAHLCTVYDVNSPDGKSKAAHELIQRIALIPDSITRSTYCQRVAERLQLHPDSLFRELNKFLRFSKNKKKTFGQQNQQQPAPEVPQIAPMPAQEFLTQAQEAELVLIELAITFEDVAMDIAESMTPSFISQGIVGQALNEVIDLTLAGDWIICRETLQQRFCSQSRKIAEKLVTPDFPADSNRENIELAFKQCMTKLKMSPLENRRDEILRLLRTASDDSQSLMQEYQNILKEIRALK